MAADKAKESTKQPLEVTHVPGDLIQAAYIFGTTPEVMTGALHGVEGELTREEAKTRLDEFLNKEVNN